MRKLIVAVLAVAVVGGLVVFGRSLANTDSSPEKADGPVDTAGVSTEISELPAKRAISVYPAPGVTSAARGTQLSFRGAPADELGEIEVVGSRSGPHTGKFAEHSDGEGASWLPDEPFTPGERVTVRTSLDITGAEDGDYTIEVARRPRVPKIRAQEPWTKGKGAVEEYVTRPDIKVPEVTVKAATEGRSEGLVFVAPKGGRGHDGPLIVDDTGRTVFFEKMPKDRVATDFRAQEYKGKPVLTWWQGGLIVGDGRGYGVIVDDRYRELAKVRMANGYTTDLHEFTITDRDTALLMSYDRVIRDLRALGGPKRGVVIAGVVQEIDIETGLVLFEWHSLDSIGLDEGKAPVPKKDGGSYDYLHLNSIDLDENGDFLLSARNTWGVYKVDRASAKLVWRLGGTKSTFQLGKGTVTAWQHHARWLPNGDIMIFDNGSSPPVHKTSRVITVRLDEQAKTATLVSEISHPEGWLAATQGSSEPLPNGNIFVGYGSQRYFAEFTEDGRLVFDAELARGNDSYRAFRMPWRGRPAERPRVSATRSGARVTAHASWNGATEVARWELVAGASRDALEPVASERAEEFETSVTASTSAPLVAMRALDADGEVLATSPAIEPE